MRGVPAILRQAYSDLQGLASRGTVFTHNQVYKDCADETPELRELPVGYGLGFECTVLVPDRETDVTVNGTLTAHVINASGPGCQGVSPAIIIRASLYWITTGGAEHVSHAFWAIPVAYADMLDNMPSLEDFGLEADAGTDGGHAGPTEGSGVTAACRKRNALNALFGAHWREGFPGCAARRQEATSEEKAGSVETALYHLEAVTAVAQSGPAPASLLSGSEQGGEFDPGKIVPIRDWLRERLWLTPVA